MKAAHVRSARIAFIAIAIAITAGGAIAQSGGNYDLHWNVPAAAGGTMSGAGYTLTGTVGQHDATPAGAMTSASCYALRGGFWAGVQGNDVIFRNGFEGC